MLFLALAPLFPPVKNCDKVFEYIESNGHLMQLAGHYVDTWCMTIAARILI